MDVESIVRKIGERQKDEVEARVKGGITGKDLVKILSTGEWDKEGRVIVLGKKVAIWKRRWIEWFAADLKIPRREYRPAIEEVKRGTFPEHLRFLQSGKKSYYFHPGIRVYLPEEVRADAERGKYERMRESDPLEEIIVQPIDKALEVATYDDGNVAITVCEYVASQFYKGVIWLPLPLHPFCSLPALKEPPFLNDEDLERMRIWSQGGHWDEWYSWLLEVRTQIVKQNGRYPAELRGASEEEMKIINEFTLLIGYSTIEGYEYPTLADGMEIPDVFEISRELVEKANIDLQGLTAPAINWTRERYHEDEFIAKRWLRSLFEFLNDDPKLWIELARKRIELQREVMRGSASRYISVSYMYKPYKPYKPLLPRYEPEAKKGFLGRKRRAKKRGD